jgi:predicted permease
MFKRRRSANDFAQEIQSHLELEADELEQEGLNEDDARRKAKIEFGNVRAAQERFYLKNRVEWFDNMLRDLRFAARQLRKSPGFSVTVILLLGLGVGATTAVFSLVDTILLKPLPYPDPSTLVIPWNVPPPGVNVGGFEEFPWSPIHFHALEQETKTYRFLGAFEGSNFNLTGAGDPVTLEGALVSWGFFPAFDVRPELGRAFTREEDTPAHEHVVVLGDALWRSRFHADPSILQRAIHLNGAPYTVVGIMPPGFSFPRANEMPGDFTFPARTQLWVPIALPAVTPMYTPSELAVIGRLQPGMSVQQAQAAMDLFAARMDREYPIMKGWSRSRVTPLQKQVAGDTRKPLLLILSAVSAVLLIVCFNVAGLLLTRSITRQHEFSLRAALGAGRARVLRQLLTENLLLAFAAGVLGMVIACAGVWLVRNMGPQDLPRLQEVGADLRIFVFASAVTLCTGLLFGVAPALGATRVDLVESLKEGGQKSGSGASHPRLRSTLVVSQMGLAVALVIVSGLLVRSFYQLLASDSGFRPDHVLTFELSLPSSEYPDRDHIARFYRQALPRLRSIAGVEMAGMTEAVPMGGATESTVIRIVGRPVAKGSRPPIVDYTIVSPGLFRALGTPLLEGRDVLDSDTLAAPAVTVINRAMARRYWPGEDPIGKRLLVPSQRVPATIIGVVADMKHSSLREVPGPEMFEPYTQNVWPSMALMRVVLRTKADPDDVIGSARQVIHDMDPGLPLAKLATLNTLTQAAMARDRFSMLLVGFFGGLALLLAAVGIYGVISYSVGQRTREIGIRMALGARRGSVFGMILRLGLKLAGLGIFIGILGALAVGRVLTGFLYGVRFTDLWTFTCVFVFLGAVALAATFFPARHAAKIDPMRALRHE